MGFVHSFAVSLTLLALAGAAFAAVQLLRRRMGWRFNAFNMLFIGVFLASFVLFVPLYRAELAEDGSGSTKALLLSLYNAVKMFALDGDADIVMANASSAPGSLPTAYTVYGLALCIAAPIMTFGFVLSFFKLFRESVRYRLSFFRDIYVFSELNERSITLASDIMNNHPSARVVFTDVFETNEEVSYELIERAHDIKAICFKKDILTIDFKAHSKKKQLYLFAIGENEIENVNHSLKLIAKYNSLENSHLYIFSTGVEGELLLAGRKEGRMKVVRVNNVRSVITHVLYDNGTQLFENALLTAEGEKQISAVIVGLGKHGCEMVKALAWYCQMEGYRIRIDAFDRDERARDRFAAQCPDLLSDKYNGRVNPDEAEYSITIHSGVDVTTKTFADKIAELKDTTYALVSLGSDEDNIRTAVELRMLFERSRMAHKPVIQAIVYNSEAKHGLSGVKNFKGQEYLIDFIGDIGSTYSEKVIIDSELEEAAYKIHMSYSLASGDPDAIAESDRQFWTQEYCYRSSVAAAVYARARNAHGSGAADSSVEHRRWNAYTRSEGYIYSGTRDPASRNDLGKMHHDLVGSSELKKNDIRKDELIIAANANKNSQA